MIGVTDMATLDIIKFDGFSDGRAWVAYKYPGEQFLLGSQLIVNPGQEAVFLKGGAICLAALFLASCTVFLSARRLAGGLDKLLDIKQPNSSFLKKGRSEAVLIALCLLPIVPTGAIPYLSARTDLSFRRFALIFPLAFAPEVFLTCAAGRSILAGDLTALIILTAVKLAIFLGYLLRRRLRSLFYSVKRGLLK